MELILNSYGTSLRKENDLFAVENSAGKHLISPTEVKSIQLSKGAHITSDAVLLAIEHEIDLLFIDSGGTPKGRVWSVKYGSIASIRKKQIDFAFNKSGLSWVKEVIGQKLENQMALILAQDVHTKEQESVVKKAINTIKDHLAKIQSAEAQVISEIAPSLRGWEGAASRRYFEALNAFLPDDYRFDVRTKHPAMDKFNALLNYGYGMLYGKVEGALIKAGIDPYLGVFHRDNYNRPVMVYDVIEKYRVWVDYVALQLSRNDAFSDECFKVENNGSYFLEGLGKRILIQGVNDYLNEVILMNGLERSRQHHIQQYAHGLAQKILTS